MLRALQEHTFGKPLIATLGKPLTEPAMGEPLYGVVHKRWRHFICAPLLMGFFYVWCCSWQGSRAPFTIDRPLSYHMCAIIDGFFFFISSSSIGNPTLQTRSGPPPCLRGSARLFPINWCCVIMFYLARRRGRRGWSRSAGWKCPRKRSWRCSSWKRRWFDPTSEWQMRNQTGFYWLSSSDYDKIKKLIAPSSPHQLSVIWSNQLAGDWYPGGSCDIYSGYLP